MVSRMSAGDGALVRALGATLAPRGLNLIGAASVDAYDAAVPPAHALRRLAPEARTALVVGNGGGDLWAASRAFRERHAGPDPIDRYTETVVDEAVSQVCGAMRVRVVYPFRFPAEPVSFMRLAACAGLGRPSLVGVLVHPVYGPWIALRAAVLIPVVETAPRPADGFDPCPTCTERACVAACPGGAVTAAGWDVPRCAAERARPDERCAERCHARFDCVVGREHRYPADALAYHQSRARPALLRSRS